MFILNRIVKKWCICDPGDPVRVISEYGDAVIIMCNGHTLTVRAEDLTDEMPPPKPVTISAPVVKMGKYKQKTLF